MGATDNPKWETLGLPPAWWELTPEQREHVIRGTLPVVTMALEELRERYGDQAFSWLMGDDE